MTYDAMNGAPDQGVGDEGMAQAQPDRSFSVMDLPKMGNVAKILDDDKLEDIGRRVHDEYKIDCDSREDKVKEWDAAGDAWNLKRTKKTYPFDNAANVKFPLLLTSAIQFSSRAMPALIHDGKVAKAKVIGADPQGEKAAMADRVGEYLNYQIMEKNTVWMAQTEKSMLQAPIYGNAFKKVYRDPVRGNCSDLISCYQFVINTCYPDLEVAPRYTCQFDLYPYQIEERKRDGRFLDIKLSSSPPTEDRQGPKKDQEYNSEDPSSPQCFLEQFRREDLDDDGYFEPYFVTIHEATQKVVRIVTAYDAQDIYLTEDQSRIARIEKSPDGTYINYEFIPDPSGSPYGIGFGKLLQDIVEIINTTANQILDAGNLQNAGGGFVGKEFRLKSGTMKVEPGLWRQTTYAGSDIRSAMIKMEHPGPAPVLFQMLGFMKEMAEKITNSTETLAGESTPNQPATTTLALIEQGLKVFTGIMGRMLRALTMELKAYYALNARYEQEDQRAYAQVGDDQKWIMRNDFNPDACDVVPVADATVITDAQKLGRSQIITQNVSHPVFGPLHNPEEALRRTYEAAGIPIEGLIKGPDPQAQQMQQDGVMLQLEELKAKIEKLRADAMKSIADARAEGTTEGLDVMKAELEAIITGHSAAQDMQQQDQQHGMDLQQQDAQHGMDMQQQANQHNQTMQMQQQAHGQQQQHKADAHALNLEMKAQAVKAAAESKTNDNAGSV